MESVLKKNPVVTLLIKAVLVSFIVSAILLLITSALMLNTGMSASGVSILVIVTYIISNFISGFIMGKGMERKKFIWGLVSGLVYFLIIFLLSIIIMSTKNFSLVTTIRTCVICLLSGMVGGMLS